MVGPLAGLLDRGAKHERADLFNHPAFLGERDELVGANRTAHRMGPTNQRLEPAYFLARGAHDRLVDDRQFVAVDRLAKIVLKRLAVGRLAVH